MKIQLNSYRIIEDAIERGINYGYRRAHKHDDNPEEDYLIEEILRSIMNELTEVIDFDNTAE